MAAELGRTRATLRLYDPYFCAGAAKARLGSLGFTSVYNEAEDFYARAASPEGEALRAPLRAG